MQYLTDQIVLTKRKTSLITAFPQLLKIMAKKAWNFRKWERKQMVSSNFQEIYNWDKARKNKNKNQDNAFCFPLIGFFTQSRTWTASSWTATWISKFYDPTDSEHKFHNIKIENWLSIGFEMEYPWLGTYSQNHYTMFNLQ